VEPGKNKNTGGKGKMRNDREYLALVFVLGILLGGSVVSLRYRPTESFGVADLPPGFHLANGAWLTVGQNIVCYGHVYASSFMFIDGYTVTLLGPVVLYEDYAVSSADSLTAFLISRGVPFTVLYGEEPSWHSSHGGG
jgi:hypothetical protein